MIELYKDSKDCCGCAACMAVCPCNAINMKTDEQGFSLPSVNESLCVECGKCKKVCAFQNEIKLNTPKKSYAAFANSDDILRSSSGGVFACMAKAVLQRGGVVFGAAMFNENHTLNVRHVAVRNTKSLQKLQGSKYVQSNMEDTFEEVKQELSHEKPVLFSGTPCQVSSLKEYLGNENHHNLFLVDIICHGTPSAKMFSDYISFLEQKFCGKIEDYLFRDKTKGWEYVSKISYCDKKNNINHKNIYAAESSYYYMFLNAHIFRESCYNCKYAQKNRPGDVSLGDYWGIETEHSEYLKKNGGSVDEKRGVSCALVNTDKGLEIFEYAKNSMTIMDTEVEKIAKHNKQLNSPMKKTLQRDEIFTIYTQNGYAELNKWFYKMSGAKFYVKFLMNRLPPSVKKFMRKNFIKK